MIILELAKEAGLNPVRASSTSGGEYKSSCPECGGNDRFRIWPYQDLTGRYWCRQCQRRGDAIQFCRDFMNLSYHEACKRVGSSPQIFNKQEPNPLEKLNIVEEPPKEWQEKAHAFVKWGQRQLLSFKLILEDLFQRGFTENTIKEFKLGCSITNSERDFFRERTSWGLPCEYREDGKERKLWLAAGLIIPTVSKEGSILKLKVRRHKWSQKDNFPKYVEISGSMQCPSVYGDVGRAVIIVLESELDAMLIQQHAGDLCLSIALGGVTKRPDFFSDQLLMQSKLILWCLDNDEAGKNAALWWRQTYQQLKFWPSPVGKSPGDALKDYGVDLREWILEGISHYTKS